MKSLDCLNSDKLNLEDEIKYFKSKVENMHKKNLQSDPNLHFYLRQQYEEELDYYKHQNLELQKVLIKQNKFRNYKNFAFVIPNTTTIIIHLKKNTIIK